MRRPLHDWRCRLLSGATSGLDEKASTRLSVSSLEWGDENGRAYQVAIPWQF